MTTPTTPSSGKSKFELEKAEHGMAMPYDAERVGQLRKMLVEARKTKLSRAWRGNGLAGKRPVHRMTSTGARFEISIDGVPRTYRDRRISLYWRRRF